MNRIAILFIFGILSPLIVFAQDKGGVDYVKKPQSSIAKSATVHLRNIEHDWAPKLMHREMPPPGHEDYEQYLRYLKENLPSDDTYRNKAGFSSESSSSKKVQTPDTLRGFKGNEYDQGIPNDNDLAISNDSQLVSVINSTIYVFDVQQDTLLKSLSLAAFADTLNINQKKYDPKVKYDPREDRFVLAFLNGNTDSTSHIIVGFSQSGNPAGQWHLYALSGNPFQSNHWSDYPMIALNEDELFITVNLIETNKSWQKGFYQSLIWQIDKMDGYQGDSLSSTIYSNITIDGGAIRNLRPVQGGDDLSGKDGLFLLSNRNFATSNDSVFLLNLTGSLDDPSATVQVDVLKVNPPYGLAPDGKQGSGGDLQTNDSRILGAFFEDNTIQYVQTTRSPQNGRAAVYHGIINDATGNPEFSFGHIITDDSLDFGYPNISYTGSYSGDDEAIINFLHTDSTTKPGSSAVFYNGRGDYSKRVTLKKGESFTDLLNSEKERWGDYTGSQPVYNQEGRVWIAGSFGQVATDLIWTPEASGTWLAKLASPDTTTEPPAKVSQAQRDKRQPLTYPNPAKSHVTVEFTTDKTQQLQMHLMTMEGKKVKTLLRTKVKAGDNSFRFSTEPLASGIYLLAIEGKQERITTKKISVIE